MAILRPRRFNAPVRAHLSRFGASARTPARPWEVAVFAGLPLVLLVAVFAAELRWGGSLGDWTIFRTASRAVVHGRSPYVAANPASLAHNDKFVYPPLAGLVLAPLALLPAEVGRVLVLLLAVACLLFAFRLLGVRDWRCYGLAFLTAPVVDSVSLGALSTLLLLGLAAAWRYRTHRTPLQVAVAATAVWKLFLWPLGLWLLATRRTRTAIEAAVLAVALVAGSWAVIGFAGLREYPHLLRVLAQVEAAESYSLAGLLRLSGGSALALSAALVLAVAAAAWLAASGADGDRRAMSIAVAGALLATPVLWLHYFVLLFVPIALYRPRLSGLWFAPLAFWATPLAHSDGSAWKISVALVTASAIVVRALGGGASLRASDAMAVLPVASRGG
jgi:alpha-1,2-mannosyltransferase